MKPYLIAFMAAGLVALAPAFTPAAGASTLPSADFVPGHTLAVGLSGLSYDYGFPGVSLGVGIQAGNDFKPMPAVRSLVRFFQAEGTSAAVIGGVTVLPTAYGTRQSIAPDLGLSLAHRFSFGEGEVTVGGQKVNRLSFIVRVNMTLTAAPRNAFYLDPENPVVQGNLFQRLNMGPQSTVAVAFEQSDHLEFTLGGGTIVGMRVKY